MADLTSGASAKIQLDPGQSLRVEAEGGTANVTALYGAPAGTTAVTGSTTFGPYSVPAVLRVVCASGACSYATVRDEPAANALTSPQVTALQAVVSEYWNADISNYVSRMATPPTSAERIAIATLFDRLKGAGLWGKIDAAWLLCASTEQAAYLNIKGTAYGLTKSGTVTHTPGLGVRGDGSAGYLATGYTPSSVLSANWELNATAIGAFVNDPTVRTANFVIGTSSSTVRLKARQVTSETISAYLNDATADAGTNNYGKVPALFSISRIGAALKNLFVGRRQQGALTTASTSVPNQEIWLLRSGSSYGTEQVSFAYIANGLRAAEVAALADAVTEYLQATMRPIFCWGDSLTYSQVAASAQSANPWPSLLQTQLGRLAYNGGVQGETSDQIRGRMMAEDFGKAGVTVIWAGRNNFTSPATVKANIASMVAWLGHSRFVIMNVINGEYTAEYAGGADYITMMALNADLKTLYPNNILEIRERLVAAYNPLDAQDVIDYGRDIVPASLRVDNIHLTDGGYLIVKNAVAEFLAAKGW